MPEDHRITTFASDVRDVTSHDREVWRNAWQRELSIGSKMKGEQILARCSIIAV